MTRITLSLAMAILTLVSCNSPYGKSSRRQENSKLSKRELYSGIMKEKNFQLILNGPCDDALEDITHKELNVYIESIKTNESNALLEFKFIDACCQEFLGDYSIVNDTLKFSIVKVNDEACSCVCWYRYNLLINEPKQNYEAIEIKVKH